MSRLFGLVRGDLFAWWFVECGGRVVCRGCLLVCLVWRTVCRGGGCVIWTLEILEFSASRRAGLVPWRALRK